MWHRLCFLSWQHCLCVFPEKTEGESSLLWDQTQLKICLASGLAQYFTLELISLSHLRVLVALWWVKYSEPILNEVICLFLLESLHYMCMFSMLKESLSQVIKEAITKVVQSVIPTETQVYALTLLEVWVSLCTLRTWRFGLQFCDGEKKSYSMSLWLMLLVFFFCLCLFPLCCFRRGSLKGVPVRYQRK